MADKPISILSNILRRMLSDPETGEERAFYVGTVRSDLAKALTFVPVLENSTKTYLQERTESGYQRPGSAARMRQFASYVKANPLSVVPPVIISGRDAWKFKASGSGDIGTLEIYEAAAIVDGQHRVGGYVSLYENDEIAREVDFFMLADLSLDEEKDEFLAINNTQKGVPKSINVLLSASDDALVANELNERDDSPFKNRITVAKAPPGALFSLAAVAKNVGRAFSHGAFTNTSIDEKVDIMIDYWMRIQDAFPEEWDDIYRKNADKEFKLLETTGLIAWCLAAADILGTSFDADTNTMNWDAVGAKISHLALPGALQWEKDGEFQGLTGEVGGAKIHKKMQQILASNVESIGDDPSM
jgi:DNA sulfur modification protein DndB